MYKIGTLRTGEGQLYAVHEIDRSNFYRLDICEQGAEFQIEPKRVLYSIYKKKLDYVIGNSKYYNAYKEVKNALVNKDYKKDISKGWEVIDADSGRKGFVVVTKNFVDNNIYRMIKTVNGKIVEEQYKFNNLELFMKRVESSVDSVLLPNNASEYESIELHKGVKRAKQTTPYIPLEELRKKYEIEHLFDEDYVYIESEEEANNTLGTLHQKYLEKKVIGMDTETDTLDFDLFHVGHIVGIILSYIEDDKDHSYYFPFLMENSYNLPEDFLDVICKWIKDHEDWMSCHNTKYDRRVFYKYGWDIRPAFDSMQGCIVVDPGFGRGKNSLKNQAYQIRGVKFLELDEIFYDKKSIHYPSLDKELCRLYACPDSPNSVRVLENKLEKLTPPEIGIFKLECKLTHVKADQEYWGFRIHEKAFQKAYDNCEYIRNFLGDSIKRVTKWTDLELSKTEQIRELLYNKMNCEVFVRTGKKQRPSTSSAALKKLGSLKRKEPLEFVTTDIRDLEGNLVIKAKDLNIAKYPIVKLLIEYRKYDKLMTSFFDKIKKGKISETNSEKGCTRYFTWINQNGAESGRQSSFIHTMPPMMKACIVADSEDHNILDADFSQIELRVLPSMAHEEKLVELCSDDNNDIHRAIGSLITHKDMWEISSDERKKGKQRNFGVVYLISEFGLAGQMFGAGATKEQIKMARDSIDEFYEAFPKIRMFLAENRQFVLDHGYIKTHFGRRRWFPELKSENISEQRKEKLIRQANNMPVQGTAADIMKTVEINYYEYIRNKGWDKLVHTPQGDYPLVRLMVSIHDEVLISVHKSIPVEEVLEMQRICQEVTVKGFAPLFASPCILDNWGEGKLDSLEIPRGLREELVENYNKTGVSVFSNDATTRKEEMHKKIQEYNNGEIVEYMEELIKEFGEDRVELANHVRHPRLTHSLIAQFEPSKEYTAEHGKLEHLESIQYAVDRYLEYRAGNIDLIERSSSSEKNDEEAIKNQLDMLSDVLVSFDKDGEIVYESPEDEDAIEDDVEIDLSEAAYIKRMTVKPSYVWKFFNAYILETGDLLMSDCDEIIKMLWKYRKKDGFYGIKMAFAGELLDIPKLYTGNLEQEVVDEIDKFIRERSALRVAERGKLG